MIHVQTAEFLTRISGSAFMFRNDLPIKAIPWQPRGSIPRFWPAREGWIGHSCILRSAFCLRSGVALRWLWGSLGVALGWLWGGLGVALGWLWGAYRLAINTPWGSLGVALEWPWGGCIATCPANPAHLLAEPWEDTPGA